MPRLWHDSIEEHRDAVREALLDAVGELTHEVGLAGLSMAAIAERAGVGRATLYRYYGELDALLLAWHERHVRHHLAALRTVRDTEGDPIEKLAAMLSAYARLGRDKRQHGKGSTAAMLHRAPHVTGAEKELRDLFEGVLADAARAGAIRRDVPIEELTDYALAALQSSGDLSGSRLARLVSVTLDGLGAVRGRRRP